MGRILRNNLLGYSGNGGEAQIFHTLKNNSILYSFSDKMHYLCFRILSQVTFLGNIS